MLKGFHHVAIICSDYPRSKAFYKDVLGFSIIDENYREARDSYKCDLGLPDGSQIELFSFPGAPQRPSRPEAQGLRHLAFKVDNLDEVINHLTNKRVECATNCENLLKMFTCAEEETIPLGNCSDELIIPLP